MITGGAEIMGATLLDIYTQIITEFEKHRLPINRKVFFLFWDPATEATCHATLAATLP